MGPPLLPTMLQGRGLTQHPRSLNEGCMGSFTSCLCSMWAFPVKRVPVFRVINGWPQRRALTWMCLRGEGKEGALRTGGVPRAPEEKAFLSRLCVSWVTSPGHLLCPCRMNQALWTPTSMQNHHVGLEVQGSNFTPEGFSFLIIAGATHYFQVPGSAAEAEGLWLQHCHWVSAAP